MSLLPCAIAQLFNCYSFIICLNTCGVTCWEFACHWTKPFYLSGEYGHLYNKSQKTFFKGSASKYFRHVSLMVCAAITQLCHCSTESMTTHKRIRVAMSQENLIYKNRWVALGSLLYNIEYACFIILSTPIQEYGQSLLFMSTFMSVNRSFCFLHFVPAHLLLILFLGVSFFGCYCVEVLGGLLA